jgi:asparagine synthase (glutamine-hydrolysing)
MYLLSRKIKAMGVKMVLSGEGSDEIFGGNSSSFTLD